MAAIGPPGIWRVRDPDVSAAPVNGGGKGLRVPVAASTFGAMSFPLVLGLYRLLLPVWLLMALPGWIVKMVRRGGFGSGLGERFSFYAGDSEWEPCGAVHVHAVSVGEAMLALKLIRAWKLRAPEQRFVLAVGTATGHQVARNAALENVRVTYAPVDLSVFVKRYLDRFEPSQLVLVEGEAWPHLLLGCREREIPVRLVNARMSPRSERRFLRLAPVVRPIFAMLDLVAAQEPEDASRWEAIGVEPEKIAVTGSLKFDPGAAQRPATRREFAEMIAAFGVGRPVVMAASTHAGEDAWIGEAVRKACPEALYVSVPRHAERRAEVCAELEAAGFEVILRSSFHPPEDPSRACLVVDSTGELRDWTAHTDAVVIGKSVLGFGGQNPAEAILADRPLFFGPHMENFEPLASRLVDAGGAVRFHDTDGLAEALSARLGTSGTSPSTSAAKRVLGHHEGATGRILDSLRVPR